MVLDAARKCRYCGYRFDAAESEPKGRLANLLPWIRTPPSDMTLPQLLRRWGVKLAPGEDVKIDAFAHVRGRHGYLVLTDRRVVFLVHEGGHAYGKLLDAPLTGVIEVALDGGRRTRLRLRGEGYDIAVLGLNRALAEQVREHVLRGGRPLNGAARPS
jgi:hypothetical protein